jgi:hypothetical protein
MDLSGARMFVNYIRDIEFISFFLASERTAKNGENAPRARGRASGRSLASQKGA